MSYIDLFVISVGLAMDAFAVSVCKGLATPKFSVKNSLIAGGYFGFFQAAMPVIGFFAGSIFAEAIAAIDHWVVFVCLVVIGGKMIKESRDCDCEADPSFAVGVMVGLAIATSIDALAVGVSLAFMNINIWICAGVIGIITFVISAAGVAIGNYFGARFKSKAELFGGCVLVFMAIKMLISG
ncbi:MAG: manganese efflux pump MntP family protein [Eubacterium sp.]|nr:manganese efflux pump MntP family protein [Eubacterium sp.]